MSRHPRRPFAAGLTCSSPMRRKPARAMFAVKQALLNQYNRQINRGFIPLEGFLSPNALERLALTLKSPVLQQSCCSSRTKQQRSTRNRFEEPTRFHLRAVVLILAAVAAPTSSAAAVIVFSSQAVTYEQMTGIIVFRNRTKEPVLHCCALPTVDGRYGCVWEC